VDVVSFVLGAIVGGFLGAIGERLYAQTERGVGAIYREGRVAWHRRLLAKLSRPIDPRHADASIQVYTMDEDGNPTKTFYDIARLDGKAERGAEKRRRIIGEMFEARYGHPMDDPPGSGRPAAV
jgi:hypothetical protein